MAIPVLELKAIEIKLKAFCEEVPLHVRDRLLHIYTIKGHSIVLAEKRPNWKDNSEWIEFPVAKFRYVATEKQWYLFYQNRNLEWRGYEPLLKAKKFETLFNEVKTDPTCIFWGQLKTAAQVPSWDEHGQG